jgi:hypothetical protein
MDDHSPTLADYQDAILALAETLGCEPHITAVQCAASWAMRENARLREEARKVIA